MRCLVGLFGFVPYKKGAGNWSMVFFFGMLGILYDLAALVLNKRLSYLRLHSEYMS